MASLTAQSDSIAFEHKFSHINILWLTQVLTTTIEHWCNDYI